MWRDLRSDIESELNALQSAVEETAAKRALMLSKPAHDPPDSWDRRAAAFSIQEIYGGIENILKRVAVVVDDMLPSGPAWHADLIRQVAKATERRPAVLSAELLPRILECLAFRHVARTHYGFDLDWERLRALLQQVPSLVEDFRHRVTEFLNAIDTDPVQ